MRAWRIRWPFWAARLATAALAALVWLPGGWPWPLQLAAACALGAQLALIDRLASTRHKRSHAWLQGYFAALDDLGCPERDESP